MKTNTLSALLLALFVTISLTGCNSAMQAYKKAFATTMSVSIIWLFPSLKRPPKAKSTPPV